MKILFVGLIFISILTSSVFAQIESPSDTLFVKGKAVIFFEFTETEYDSLLKDEESELVEVISDFYYYRDKVIPDLKEEGISSIISDHEYFKILLDDGRKIIYERKQFEYEIGIIFTNGKQEPKVNLGVRTDVGLWQAIKEFFK